MPQIRSIADLKNGNEISEICHTQSEPVFITKNGHEDMVIMSIEVYKSIMETAESDAVIAEAEAGFTRDEQLYDAREALSKLRSKYFGEI